MKKIENFQDVWDNGTITSASLTCEEIDNFKYATGASRVVARRWSYEGRDYQTSYFVRLLKNEDGFVHYKNNDPHTKCLIVLNGDNTQRVVINVPRVDEHSKPEEGYLALPPSSACFGGIEWGCEGNDGYTDYLFDFDWHTGALLRYARSTRPW